MRNPPKTNLREIWIQTRSILERENIKHKRYGIRSKKRWDIQEYLIHGFGYLLKATGFYKRGLRNAQNIGVKELTIQFEDLPPAFDGYKILHLTDLHLDSLTGIEDVLYRLLQPLQYNLCVLTGDYREHVSGGFKNIKAPLQKILSAIQAQDGIYTTLGNHDSYLMVDFLEHEGITVLGNEKILIKRNNQLLDLTGVDDTAYYYTSQVDYIIEQPSVDFKILLSHTPDLYELAADNDFALYLCGHTHGGQVCLPGSIPVITHTVSARKYACGFWRFKQLQGYTSPGCGVVSLPVRFNSRAEISLITLKQKRDDNLEIAQS